MVGHRCYGFLKDWEFPNNLDTDKDEWVMKESSDSCIFVYMKTSNCQFLSKKNTNQLTTTSFGNEMPVTGSSVRSIFVVTNEEATDDVSDCDLSDTI